jgi:serpin B
MNVPETKSLPALPLRRARATFAVLLIAQSLLAAAELLPKLATANNAFAFKLLKELAAENKSGNLFVSPYSIATALQVAANGAAGQTKIEMQQVLQISGLSASELNPASKAAADSLNSGNTNIILTTANALWYRRGEAIRPGFLEANQTYFASTIRAIDFRNVPAAEGEINQWVSDQTHGRITGIANGMIDPIYTDLVLANAIYFKGKWLDPFDVKATKGRAFHPLQGVAKNVPMMEMSKHFQYRKGSGYQAVRLPYMGNALAMYVFLPDTGSSPAKLVQIINGDNWRRVTMPGFSGRDGRVVLPKFKLETTTELKPVLKKLGMTLAFNDQKSKPDADFSQMFNDPHHISDIRQKAFVEVNEEGTEATAATFLTVESSSALARPKPFEMVVDRPFLFAIVDASTEMVLFLGVINNL